MTFDPHPPRVVRPDKAPPLLMTTAQQLEAIAAAGLQGAAIVRFTPEMSRWEPETFVQTVLVDWLRVADVWVGANFLFGHDRAGNFSLLRVLGGRYGFKAEKIDPVRYKDFVVSSTRIRRLVGEGRVDEAGALLGHQDYIDGTVVEGDRAGQDDRLSDREPRPRTSCAAARRVRDDGDDRRCGAAVGDQHRRPADRRYVGPHTIETHVFDFDGDHLRSRRCRLGFVQRLRDERAFESLDALRTQIGVDCGRARVLVRSPFAVESRDVAAQRVPV